MKCNREQYQDKIFESKKYGSIKVIKYISAIEILIEFLNTGWTTTVAASQLRSGNIRDQTVPNLLYGWGVVDVEYPVTKTETLGRIDGKRKQKKVWICPYYGKWSSILSRVFSVSYKERRPNYKGCTISEEWKYLSNFIKWVNSQPNRDWMNCEPDKDILFDGNKHYSPDTVVFVDHITNKFILDSKSKRRDCLLGVDKSRGKFRARCKDPFNIESPWLGYFDSEIDAHLAWKSRKHEYSCKLAKNQQDERVAFVLSSRYNKDSNWSNR